MNGDGEGLRPFAEMSGTGEDDTELFDSLAGVEAGDGWLLP